MLGGGSMSNAYAFADMAGLQGSQLQQLITGTTAQKTDIENQLLNAKAGYNAMNLGGGAYGAGVQAIQVLKGLQQSELSTLNGAYDTILGNATRGTTPRRVRAGIGVISALGKTRG